MATQLKPDAFAPAPFRGFHTKPKIRVAFSAGTAMLAVRDKAATTPEADSTLDEIAARSPHANTPLRTLLAERNAIMARMNDGPSLSDADAPAVWKQITAIEAELFGRDALTPDDAIVKLIAAAQVTAEGHELDDTEAAGAILQAKRHFGIGYVHRQLLDALPAMEPVAAHGVDLGLLLGKSATASAAWDAFYKATVRPAEERYFAIRDTDAEASTIEAARRDYDAAHEAADALLDADGDAIKAVCNFPAANAADLRAKLVFMVDGQLGHGMDWTAELLADAERIAGTAGVTLDADSAILDAFAARRREFVASFDSDMTSEEEGGYFDRMEAYEATILNTPATTIAGTVAKLRITFMHTVQLDWTDWTIIDPTHPDFVAGLAEADLLTKGQWSAIEDLARIGGVNLAEQGL